MLIYKNTNFRGQMAVVLLSVFLLNGFAMADRLDLTDINSQWRFSYYGSNAGAGTEGVSFNDSSWSTVDIPHTWNALDTQDGINNNYARGFGWYRKHYTIGSEYSGKRVYLFFESVGKKADVYCNGNHIGYHLGAYGAFCYDITDQVNFGGDNVIAVRADNANTSSISSVNIIPQGGDFNQYGGICRNVHVIITEPVHITLLDYASPGVYLTPTNVSASSADLEVKVLVRNTEASTQSVTVRAKIYDADDVLVDTLQTTQSISADTTEDVIQNTVINNPHLWNGRVDPYLYKVITEVEVGGVVVDTVQQPLGFRYFSLEVNNGFILNGQYLDLHGVAMHEDRKGKGRAISDADREQDNALMLEMGCTWIRPSHYQHAEKFYDLCDESGIVISTEIPIVNSVDTSSTAFADNCKDQLKELIRQNYNHPSVCFWLLYNELATSGSDTLIGELNDLAHAEDPTRPTTCAHNTTSDYASFSYITDSLAYNRYMGWYGSTPEAFAPWADSIHAGRSDDAIGITEYGAGANPFQHQYPPVYPGPSAPFHPEEYQAYYHEVYWQAMEARPWLWCKTIWNGFDFAVDGRNEGSQIELNDKGMVTRDRAIKKDTFYWYKANWTTDPMVYITGRRFTERPTNEITAKVYSNCETVELFLNGVSQGSTTSTNQIFTWPIVLRTGTNNVQVVGTRGTNAVNDSVALVWVYESTPVSQAKPASASSQQSGNEAVNGNDGSLATRWGASSGSYPQWWKVDLGSVQSISKAIIRWYNGSSRAYQYQIWISDDDSSYSLLADHSGNDIYGDTTNTFSASARYVRVDVSAGTSGWASFYECQISGDSESPAPAPDAPNDLTVTNVSSSQIDLVWNASSNAVSYRVKRAASSGGPYSVIATGLTAPSYSDLGLPAGTTYYYAVSAVNAGGESSNSTYVATTTLALPPAAPTGLDATPGDIQVSLNWDASTGVTGYFVKRSTVSTGPYTIITNVNVSSYSDTGLANGITYFYVVSALNAFGESDNSSEVNALPGKLLSEGKPVAASSYEPGNDATKGNDGNLYSRWAASSASFPQWWRVDLGSVQSVNRARIAWYSSASRAYQYRIEISNNDASYSTVINNTANSSYGDTDDTFSATGRYLRITVTGAGATSGWAGFYECRIESTVYVPTNIAPTVYAGLSQTCYLPNDVNLSGNAVDDGNPDPPASMITTWSKVSGPGSVVFGDPHALATSASFSDAGTYELQLEADDGELMKTSSTIVRAYERPQISIELLPDAFRLSWPTNEDSGNWWLQSKTNLLDADWMNVPDLPVGSQIDIPINTNFPSVYYRLVLP